MGEKKYKLSKEIKNCGGYILHRIEALKYFMNVSIGEKGGWVESEKNLSQEGDCRVYGNAKVFGKAKVLENAQVRDNVIVKSNAKVSGNAIISGKAQISNNANIKSITNFLYINPIGARNDSVTFYKTVEGIHVVVGRFNGSIDAFEQAVQETHGNNEYAKQYKAAIQLARLSIRV